MPALGASTSASPSPPMPTGPNKRKKISTACDACQRRKSRCEMVNSQGCHRCRTLGTSCSVAGTVPSNVVFNHELDIISEPGGSNPNIPDNGPILDSGIGISILRDVQARTRRLEGMLEILTRHTGYEGLRDSNHEPQVDGTDSRTKVSAAASANRALGLTISHFAGPADPVSSGLLLSSQQWVQIYKTFLKNIDNIIPLSTLLPLDPTPPYLKICILLHHATTLPSRQTPAPLVTNLVKLINHFLENLSFIAPSRSMVITLLILSLLPPGIHAADQHVLPDTFNSIARAMEVGYGLGLDRVEERVTREDPVDLEQEWLSEDVKDMMLWRVICHRVRWVDILNSPSLLARRNPQHTLYTAGLSSRLHEHLVLESEQIASVDAVLICLRTLRTSRSYDTCLFDDFESGISAYHSYSINWRQKAFNLAGSNPSVLYLILSGYLFDILLYLNISDLNLIPTPIISDLLSRLPGTYSSRILTSSSAALDLILDHPDLPLSSLPAFSYTSLLLGYKAVSQSRKLEASTSADTNTGMLGDRDRIGLSRTRLLRAHPQYAPVLANIDGTEAPRIWGDAMRTLQQSRAGQTAGDIGATDGWEDWTGLFFDFDSFFGTQSGLGLGDMQNPFGQNGDMMNLEHGDCNADPGNWPA